MSQLYDSFQTALKKKAPATRKTYSYEVDYMVKALKLKSIDELFQGTAKEIEDRIISYNYKLSYSKANKLLAALDILCAVNAITLNFTRLYMLAPPEPDKKKQYPPYPKLTIQQVVASANEQTELAVLLMSTSAMRIGALPALKWEDTLYLEKYKLHAIYGYRHTSAQYITFCSPQASERLIAYRGKRKDTDFIFFNQYEPDLPTTEHNIAEIIRLLLVRLGIREPKANRYERHDIQLDHGFRKYARTTWDRVGIREDYAERLEGVGKEHVKTYSIPAAIDWLEMTQYYKAIQELTF